MGELGDDPVAVIDRDRVAVARLPARVRDVPAAGASMGVPLGAVTSMPSCGRATCRIGCARMDENALVNQPWVGMIEGRGGETGGVNGEAVGGVAERGGQQIGPPDQAR